MKFSWTIGNSVKLLENGEEYFPRVFDAIRHARSEVLIETFILFEDKVGYELQEVLIDAARRGVSVMITVDGWGSPEPKLSEAFTRKLTDAGVSFRVYGPTGKVLGIRLDLIRRIKPFRRMHRKIVVVDRQIAFIGGINFSADHLADYGPLSKQDYAVELQGPIVDDLHRFVERAAAPAGLRARWRRWRAPPVERRQNPRSGNAEALLVTRDNRRHTTDIEQHYLRAIRSARREIVIANAYFFPSYRLLRAMRDAARRGVRVQLILQGEPDMFIVPIAARLLYEYLVTAGVEVYEYCRRPLHGKVALTDDVWSTVGSSNLDPLSLSLHLEANVMLRDRAFNQVLRGRLRSLIDQDCIAIDPETLSRGSWWRGAVGVVAFHFTRHFPSWAQRFPTRPSIAVLTPSERERLSQESRSD
jgi:cardiolipin synthase A/B